MNPLAHVWVVGLINSFVAGALVAVIAWALIRAVGGNRPKIRFAIWFGALLTVAILCSSSVWMSGSTATRAAESAFVLADSWARILFYVWVGGSVVFMLRIAVGFYQIIRLRRGSRS